MERIIAQIVAAGAVHSNTTTEDSLVKQAFGPSGFSLQAGKVYRVRGMARVTAENSTDTVTMAVRWGTNATTPTSNTAEATSAAVDSAVGDVSIVDLIIDCQSPTRAVMYGTLSDCDASGSKLLQEFAAILTIDPTLTYYLDYTADWSAASASDSIQAESFIVTELVGGA